MKKVGTIQKSTCKEKIAKEEKSINSKANVEKIKNTEDEINKNLLAKQIDYDDLPDGVYDFSGLAEFQHRKTKPNLKENEKVLKTKYKKDKPRIERNEKIIEFREEHGNIVEELFEAKKKNEKTINNNFLIDEENEEPKEITQDSFKDKEAKEEKSKKEESEKSKFKKQVVEEDFEKNLKIEGERKEIDKNIPEIIQPSIEVLESKKEKEKSKYEEMDEDKEKTLYRNLNCINTNQKFAFLIMFFLGVITQISFLATSRENNLTGLFSIFLSAISIFLLISILDIQNKFIIFIISLVAVFIPYYNDKLITGRNGIVYSFSIILAIFPLNLIFAKRNQIICFVLAVLLYSIGYKIYSNCMQIFLVISILKILKELLNRREKIIKLLLHCVMICAILAVRIFL